MTRVVIDANVLASAAAGHPDSPSRRLLNALAAGRIEAVLCDRILREVDRALQRPYFLARVTPIERRMFGEVLRAVAECSLIPSRRRRRCAIQATTILWRWQLPVAPMPS